MIEISGKTVFRDGRSHYKKTGIILGIVLAVTFLAGNVLGASSSPDSHIDNLTEEYGSWHVGYFDANYVFKQTLLKDDRVTDVVSFDNVGYRCIGTLEYPLPNGKKLVRLDFKTYRILCQKRRRDCNEH